MKRFKYALALFGKVMIDVGKLFVAGFVIGAVIKKFDSPQGLSALITIGIVLAFICVAIGILFVVFNEKQN
jgi:uncharacterized membrane protein YraQ (UPF0718 family)